MKVSVIVPVYNATDTITACLGNLLNQTLSDMEIILVDDASTDGSDKILQDAKNQFPEKVRVFRQEVNQGPGAARNVGLSVARGDYIGFVDADDVVDVTMYEKLYSAATKDAGDIESSLDIADCAFYRESQKKALLHFDGALTGRLDAAKKSDLIAAGGFTVTKLFKRSLIEGIGLRFRAAYGLEDMDFLVRALAGAMTVCGISDVLYIYKDSDASLSKEMDFGKYYKNHIGAMTGIYERMRDLPDYGDLQLSCEYCMLALYSNVLKLGYKMRDEIGRELLIELLSGLRQVRKSCATIPVKKNPYLKRMDKEDIDVIEIADESVERLLGM